MPELNLDNEDLRAEIVEIVSFWYEKGVSGFRLDAAKYPYLYEEERTSSFGTGSFQNARKSNLIPI
jgi:glycosidase